MGKGVRTWRKYWRNTGEGHDPETLAHLKIEIEQEDNKLLPTPYHHTNSGSVK